MQSAVSAAGTATPRTATRQNPPKQQQQSGWVLCAQSPPPLSANGTKCCSGLRAEPPRKVSSIKSPTSRCRCCHKRSDRNRGAPHRRISTKDNDMTKKPEPLDPEEFDRIAATLEALGILFPSPSQPMPVARKLMRARDSVACRH